MVTTVPVHVARKKRCHRHHASAASSANPRNQREKNLYLLRDLTPQKASMHPLDTPQTPFITQSSYTTNHGALISPSALLGSLEHASNELAETPIVGVSGALRKVNKEVLASFAGKHRGCSARGSGSRLVDLQVSLCFCFGGWKVVWASPGRLAGPALGQF